MSERPRVALVGMGGYAADHHGALRRLEQRGVLVLACGCDPRPEAREKAISRWQLVERGVQVYDDFAEMLEQQSDSVDILSVVAPIERHEPMHAAGVARGLAVYLEKPPTLDPAELAAMIARDAGAEHQTLVGFNFILEPTRRELKQRLLSGDFGRLESLCFLAVWPRTSAYFARAPWAGRLLSESGRLILDSCLGNATAHFSHNLLFWAGQNELDSWGMPGRVRARLYRAHRIQGADTFFVGGETEGGTRFRIAVTHASSRGSRQSETVVCEKATIVYDAYGDVRIHWKNGTVETVQRRPFDPLSANYLDFVTYLSGHKARPHTTLRDSEPFVRLNALCYLASGRIHAFEPARLARVRDESPGAAPDQHSLSVVGLEAALDDFVAGGDFPNLAEDDSAPPRAATESDLSQLPACVRAMASESDAQP